MPTRKYWMWIGPKKEATTQALVEKYKKIKSHGITGIFLEHELPEAECHAIKESGLELHAWMWTVNRGDKWIHENHPEWYQVSRSGKSCFDQPPYVGYYKWVCPSIPAVVDYISDQAHQRASNKLVDGVHLDYVRYPDVILPKGLWKKYNLDQTEELPDYDFCYSDASVKAFKERYGYDPKTLDRPDTDQNWLHFRYNNVTNLVNRLVQVVHGEKKVITAAVFPTPSMARKICRQDWDKWPLDAVCPMTYNKFYEAEVDWIGDCIRENIDAVTYPVYAGLFLPDFKAGDLSKAVKVALHRGAKGVSLFGTPNDDQWKEFEAAIANS